MEIQYLNNKSFRKKIEEKKPSNKQFKKFSYKWKKFLNEKCPVKWVYNLSLDVYIVSPFGLVCCCSSVAQSCLTLCYPMDCSMPGFSVLHCLPEFAQTHVHWISDTYTWINYLSFTVFSKLISEFSLHQMILMFSWNLLIYYILYIIVSSRRSCRSS